MGPGHSQSVFEPSRIGHAVGIHKSDIFSTRSAYSQISSRVGAGAFLDKQSHALTALRDGEAFIQGAIIHQDYLIFVPRYCLAQERINAGLQVGGTAADRHDEAYDSTAKFPIEGSHVRVGAADAML